MSFQKLPILGLSNSMIATQLFKNIYKGMLKTCGKKWSDLNRKEQNELFIEFEYEGDRKEIDDFLQNFLKALKGINYNKHFKKIFKKSKVDINSKVSILDIDFKMLKINLDKYGIDFIVKVNSDIIC